MTRATILLCAALFLAGAVLPLHSADHNAYQRLGTAQVQALIPAPKRTVIDLSGPWQREINGSAAGTAQIPSSEELASRIVYKRSVRIEGSTLQSHSWQLQFFGVSDEVELRINGRFVLRYPGGLIPFTARIPERILTSGTNTIELAVSPAGEKTQLIDAFGRSSKKMMMGIVREVFLVGTPHVWTNDVKTTVSVASNRSSASVAVSATVFGGNVDRLLNRDGGGDALANDKVPVSVEAILTSPNGSVVATSGATTVITERARQTTTSFQLGVQSPVLWSTANPALYTVTIRVSHNGTVVDEFSHPVGIRNVRITTLERGRGMQLNDSNIIISGVEYVEEYPNLGPSMSWRQMEQDVAMMKTLGINVVRFRHGSPHPYFLHLCDKYGLMVFAELPAADIPEGLLEHEEVMARLRNAAERLVSYADSHPAVIAYGVSDGIGEGTPTAAAFHGQLVKTLRAGGSKLLYKVVTAGCLPKVSEGGFDIIMARFTTIDERARLQSLLQGLQRTVRTAAILTNFGAVISPANMNGFSDPLSNEAQAVSLRNCYKTSISNGMAGCIVWSFNDYTMEKPTMLVDHYDAYTCTSGLVDVWRQPRVSYSMLKSLVNDEKEPLLQARDYSPDTPLVFIVTGLVLALVLTFLINRSRRFREYVLRAVLRPYNFYADIRDQRILSTIQTTILGAVIASCLGLVIASLVFFLRTDPDVEYLLHLLMPSNLVYGILRAIAWQPALSLFVCSAIVLLLLLAIAVILRVGAMFVRGRIYYRDTLTIAVWSALPLVVLLPIGIALYKMLSTDAMSLWIPVIIGLIVCWFIFRMLRATAVVFDAPPLVVYGIGAFLILCTAGITFWMYSARYDLIDFLTFYVNVVSA